MLTLVAPPSDPVLTVAALKTYLRVDGTDQDNDIQAFINAAVDRMDGRNGILGRCLRPQTWRLSMPCFPRERSAIRLPLPPTIDVEEISYLDNAGNRVTLDSYRLIPGGEYGAQIVPILGQCWPRVMGEWTGFPDRDPDTVQIVFRAGYQTLESPEATEPIPASILIAIKMLVGDWFENRVNTIVGTNVMELPQAVSALIAPLRVTPVA